MIGFPAVTNQKSKIYNSILVIVNQLRKMIYKKSIKVTIDIPSLAEIIYNIIVKQ